MMGSALIVSQIMLQWLDRAMQAGTLLTTLQTEKRDPTPEEMKALYAADDLARKRFQDIIDAMPADPLPMKKEK